MYDARGSSEGGSGHLLFAIVALVVVGLAFLVAWFGGGLFSGKSSTPIAENVSLEGSVLAARMSSPEEQRFLMALSTLDSGAYARLEREYTSAGDRDAQLKTVGEAAGRAVMGNVEHLAHISADDINRMLGLALREVGEARRADHELCRASSYTGVQNMNQQQRERWLAGHGLSLEAAYQDSVEWQADILEMIERAKRSPQRHGKVTSQDEQAVQRLILSLSSDPAIMQLLMSNGDPSAMGNVNVCAMAETLLREVRALPDGTKARTWAALFDTREFRQAMRQARQMGL